MTAKTLEEHILDLYARYRRSGWRFKRTPFYGGAWGISFVCAGSRVRIIVKHGQICGWVCTGEHASPIINMGIDGDMIPNAYETLYRRLDKKAGVTRGK